MIVLVKEDIEALQEGKTLAWDDGEYSTFVLYWKEGTKEKLIEIRKLTKEESAKKWVKNETDPRILVILKGK